MQAYFTRHYSCGVYGEEIRVTCWISAGGGGEEFIVAYYNNDHHNLRFGLDGLREATEYLSPHSLGCEDVV